MSEITNEIVEQSSPPARQPKRVWFSSFIGAAIEYYDFSIYATAAALVFGPLFFSPAQASVGVVLSFLTLAAGYVARPIGAMVFGHFGDKIGRKTTLITTVVLMGVATTLIGVLPTYASVGALAPILLVTLRVVQGLSVGGEWGGAVVMTTEHSSTKRRSFMGSATAMGSAFGVLLGSAAFSLVVSLTGENFLTWGWRLPFLATVVLFGLAIYMRLRITESPVMVEAVENNAQSTKPPITVVFSQHGKRVALAAGVFAGPFMIQSLMSTFFISYGVTELGMSRSFLLNASIIGIACSFIGIPIGGLLADKFGRRRVLATGVTLATLNLLLLVPLFTSATTTGVILAYALVYTFHSLCLAPIGALYSELFPTAVRYTGVGMSYQFSSLIGGGLGPVAASLLIANGLGLRAVLIMLVVFCLLAGYCVFRLPRTDDVDLRDVGATT
ncbi:MHS family MFS transporter [Rhodococcus sp. IC4_135]|uniref:MFS transporter n=1 Tax=Rhodococcus sp. IC4_135 TaxID=2715537 RepID=UPI001423B9AD|nr:MHS family MFS transporter [Rhodococcus sp. IC4_135]